MFNYLNGTVAELETNMAVIDVGGVGYEVNTSAYTVSRLKTGDKAKLYTHLHVREDSVELFGFGSKSEKHCFEMLIGITGVGPKAALSILSMGSPEALVMAIVSGDDKALTAAQGVGKKIAQRIVLELRDKLAKETSEISFRDAPGFTAPADGSKLSDVRAALAALGYGPAETAAALSGIDIDAMSLEEAIRAALKRMMK
jgi:Holliday junction DNA helicase RuvA